jgi:hypothetical protein
MDLLGGLAFLLVAAQDAPDPFVQKVSDLVRARAAALISKAAAPKTTPEEALAQAAKLDDAIVDEVSKKLSVTAAEVREAWKKRERKSKTVGYGPGSWIVQGGQDGGLDSAVKGTPVPEDNLMDRGPSILTKRKPPPPPEPVPLGKPLKTKAEWWAAASPGERSACVEAEYARKSELVEKKEETKKCATCSGRGTLNTNRGGIGLVIVCGRCHGSKEDIVLHYE